VIVEPQNAGGTDPEKDVVVLVEEAKRYTIAYAGVSKCSAWQARPIDGRRVGGSTARDFEISKQNLTGRADLSL